MRIAIFDYRIIRTNPIGGCHLKSMQGLSGDHRFTVFSVEFENPDPDRIEWVRIPAPKRPLALLFVMYHLMAPIWYLIYCLRRKARFDLIQMVECNLSFGNVAYSQFCHRAYLRNHWKRSRPAGIRGLLRLLDHALHAACEPFLYRRVRQIVVPSEGLARELSATYPGVSEKVTVVSNPVDTKKLQLPDNFERQPARARLGIGPNDLMLVFAALGQFERKGLPIILDAIRQLKDPRIKLYVVGGEADLVRSYEKQVRQMGLGGSVTFAGSQRDVRPYLWAADVFVLPSFYETFSLVSFEAAAAGLPLIVGRLYGVEDLMRSRDCGYVVDTTAEAVAAAIARFGALDTAARARLAAGAKTGAARYSSENFVDAWRKFYSSPAVNAGSGRLPSAGRLVTQKLPPVRITSTHERRPALPALTGLRAVAAIWIVLLHCASSLGLHSLPTPRVNSSGGDLFLLLSGFLLTYNYFPKFTASATAYWTFLWNRFARIYPLYLATLAALAIIAALTSSSQNLAQDLLNRALLTQWQGTSGLTWRESPVSAVGAEWFACALIFPLACLALRRVRSTSALALIIAAAFLTSALARKLWSLQDVLPLYQAGVDFFAGCCLSRIADRPEFNVRRSTQMVNWSVFLLVALTLPATGMWSSSAAPLCFGLLIAGLAKSGGAVARVLSRKALVYLGTFAFSLLMISEVADCVIAVTGLPSAISGLSIAAQGSIGILLLLLTFLIASAVHGALERPAQAWLRTLMKTQRSMASASRPLRSTAL